MIKKPRIHCALYDTIVRPVFTRCIHNQKSIVQSNDLPIVIYTGIHIGSYDAIHSMIYNGIYNAIYTTILT